MAIKSSNPAEGAEELILLAQEHGAESEPDMEVGDLQQMLRWAWLAMNERQQQMVYRKCIAEIFDMEDDG